MSEIDVDYSHDSISEKTDKDYQLEFENKRDKKYFRKLLFYVLGCLVIVMFIVSFTATYCYIFRVHIPFIHIDTAIKAAVSTKGNIAPTILLSLTLMIPTVLALAMMRFLFGNTDQVDEKNIPSIVFNIGKELKETFLALIKKD